MYSSASFNGMWITLGKSGKLPPTEFGRLRPLTAILTPGDSNYTSDHLKKPLWPSSWLLAGDYIPVEQDIVDLSGFSRIIPYFQETYPLSSVHQDRPIYSTLLVLESPHPSVPGHGHQGPYCQTPHQGCTSHQPS